MELWQALVLGIIEGLTEFLPVSSTGHLTVAEELMGLRVDDPGVTAFTAIIQTGAILAVIFFFRRDIVWLVVAFVRGLGSASERRSSSYREAWCVIIGTIPIGVVGLATRDLVSGPLRSLWVVAGALIVWSAVMVVAERVGRQGRGERDLTLRDAVVVGAAQCVALVPGVSRSGATISAGLFRGLDRVAATRLSFLLSIPALVAAGGLEAVTEGSNVADSVGWTPTLVATVVSLLVAYASIAWLLRLVAHHSITVFVGYRVALGAALAVALGFRVDLGDVSASAGVVDVRLVVGLVLLVALTAATLSVTGVRLRAAVLRAVARAAVQLAVVGALLGAVFSHPWAVGAVLLVMLGTASLTAGGRLDGLPRARTGALAGVLAGAAPTLAVVFGAGVVPATPRYVVAVGGIVIGGTLTATVLTGRRLLDGLRTRREEVEGWLALGATPRRAAVDVVRTAVGESLLPALDQTRTVALVTLPGAFVGALFGGASPAQAARFQLVVLVSLLCAQALAAASTGWLWGAPRRLPAVSGWRT